MEVNILHLEDDPADAELVQAKLQETDIICHITMAQTQDEFETALRENKIDIIIADYRLPVFDGLSALKLVKDCYSDIPFIFVSGTMGEAAAIKALTQGATDYVLKHNLSRLGVSVERALQEARNQRKRKQTEEALQHSNEMLRAIIEAAPVAILDLDLENRVHSVWNPTAERMLGWSASEVIGRRLPIPDEHKESLTQWGMEVRNGISLNGKELCHQKSDGTLIDFSIHTSPLYDVEGQISGNIVVLVDISGRKNVEDQLRQSQKLEAIGQLAGGMAHDFNNMLGVIIGAAELSLDNQVLDDVLQKNLKAILAAAYRSSEVTRKLLAFAREQTIVPKVLDLNNTIGGMQNLLRRLIGEHIDLVWSPGPDLWPIKMDPIQIDQILVNLCVNAQDAISKVGTITVKTHNVELNEEHPDKQKGVPPGEYVMLTVSDSGSGMEKATMDKIFEPFFTTKEVGKGTGLGLATVYGIIKQNGGFINVHSKPGHGSTFKMFLARNNVVADQKLKADPVLIEATGHETILLVEDEALLLKMSKMVLEKCGYHVLPASVPSEALRLAHEHNEIHLLLSDVVMPQMNGQDLAKEIIALCPSIKCLFMSGYAGNNFTQNTIQGEGFHFIQKPFTNQNLTGKVREILDGK